MNLQTPPIWVRYFLQQFIKMFVLFLGCFYGLYVLIDYASHTSLITLQKAPWQDIVRYYIFVLASRAEILIPIALLIAFVHTICTLNNHRELVALMACGFSLKRLMLPFIVIGLIGVFLIYANEQFLLPKAMGRLKRIKETTKYQKHRHTSPLIIHHVNLEDGSLLIYQEYVPEQERFLDIYWIQSIDHIYHMQSLAPAPIPTGYFVDYITRQPNGELLQQAAYPERSFPNMKFNPDMLLQSTNVDADLLSLSELIQQAFEISSHIDEKESKILTALYWKLAIPWICLLAILAPAPFCVRFSRQFPTFLIYICSLFGLIAFYMFMDAAQVVAKRQVLHPAGAILIPFLSLLGYFSWRFRTSLEACR